MRQSGEAMTSVSAGHIILTPTQPVGIYTIKKKIIILLDCSSESVTVSQVKVLGLIYLTVLCRELAHVEADVMDR